MPWTQRYADQFNRANASPLTPAPWTNYGGGNPNPCQLFTFAVMGTGAGQNSVSHYSDTIKDDQYAQATVDSSGSQNAYFGVAVLFGGGGGKNGYLGAVLPQTNTWAIFRYSTPAVTGLASGGYGGLGTHILRLEILGGILTLYKNGAVLGSVASNIVGPPVYTTGWPGVYATTQAPVIDDWSAGDWTASGGHGSGHGTGMGKKKRGGEFWGIVPEVAPYLG
jgi:hypothetical protein